MLAASEAQKRRRGGGKRWVQFYDFPQSSKSEGQRGRPNKADGHSGHRFQYPGKMTASVWKKASLDVGLTPREVKSAPTCYILLLRSGKRQKGSKKAAKEKNARGFRQRCLRPGKKKDSPIKTLTPCNPLESQRLRTRKRGYDLRTGVRKNHLKEKELLQCVRNHLLNKHEKTALKWRPPPYVRKREKKTLFCG